MTRLLFVVNSADFFLSHRLPVALAAREAGFEVHVATPPSLSAERIRELGLEHHPYPLGRRTLAPWTELRTVFALWALYRALRPGIVHHVGLKAILYGTLGARMAGIPAVVNAVTGLGYLFSAGGLGRSILRRLTLLVLRPVLRDARVRMIFQNPDDRAQLENAGVTESNQAVLIRGSGVEMWRYRATPEPPGPPVVLFASRMLWDKGVGEFVEAAKVLRSRGVAARFVLAGDTDAGNPKAVPSRQLAAWQADGIVEWLGHRRDMPDVFARSAIVVLPSVYGEGVPKVLIEAAACGRPIVTTDTPGCREIVQDGHNGFLVPPRDPEAVAAAVHRLLADPCLRAEMGRAGRDLVNREFRVELVTRATLEVYADALPRGADADLSLAG